MLLFIKSAWSWLKKYWMWLLFPVGALLFILGKLSVKKPPDVVAPELVDAEKARRRAQEDADQKAFEAAKLRAIKVDEIRAEHSKVINELTDTQRAMAKGLEDDPDKLNDFLLDVGSQIRG